MDGNCFYRKLSLYFTDNENYHNFFRHILYYYINTNKEDIKQNNPYNLYKDTLIPLEQYIPYIHQIYKYAEDLEIGQSSILFKLNIAIYKKDTNNNNKYKYYYYYNIPDKDFILDLLILLYNDSKEHY